MEEVQHATVHACSRDEQHCMCIDRQEEQALKEPKRS
jgi:hypothetical protein